MILALLAFPAVRYVGQDYDVKEVNTKVARLLCLGESWGESWRAAKG
jgi:hypothetical protein